MTWIDEYYRNEMQEALRQKDKEREEALKQKDKEIEEALRQKDILNLKNLVQHVDNLMRANRTSLDNACAILDTPLADYYEARAVLARAANQ